MASKTLLLIVPAEAVDVSGNNNYIAVGWGRNVSFIETYASPPNRLKWSRDTEHQVFNVVLSENGDYLAVTSNELPVTGFTHAYLSLYRTSDGTRVLHEQLDYNTARAFRPIDISRDGSYVAVGTASWPAGYLSCMVGPMARGKGTVYLFNNPDIFPPGVRTYQRFVYGQPDCVTSVRFSGNAQYLVAGLFWFGGADVLDVPNLKLQATTLEIGSAVAAVAISYDGWNISTGQIWDCNVTLWNFAPGNPILNRQWGTRCETTYGDHGKQAISDDGKFIFTRQDGLLQTWPPEGDSGFIFFNSTIPDDPEDKRPMWSYISPFIWPRPVGLDLSVSNSAYGIGTQSVNIHLWGDGSTPLSNVRFDFTANDTVTDAAISYFGPIAAATDNNGYLYVFDLQLPEKLFWLWHTPT